MPFLQWERRTCIILTCYESSFCLEIMLAYYYNWSINWCLKYDESIFWLGVQGLWIFSQSEAVRQWAAPGAHWDSLPQSSSLPPDHIRKRLRQRPSKGPGDCSTSLRPYMACLGIIFFIFGLCQVFGCCVWAFSSCCKPGVLFIAVHRLLLVRTSLVAEHGL